MSKMLTAFAVMLLTSSMANASVNQLLNFYTEEYPPWNYTSGNEVIGLNTKLIQQALIQSKLKGRFLVIPWGRAQRLTQTEQYSCFYSAVRTTEREALYQWVGPLSREYVQLFSLNPDLLPFHSLAAASNLVIGGQTGDAYTDYVAQLGLSIERVGEIPTNLSMLQLGRIDLWLAGSVGGPYIAAKKGLQLFPVATSEPLFELWLACNKNIPKQIIERLNNSIKAIKQVDYFKQAEHVEKKAGELQPAW